MRQKDANTMRIVRKSFLYRKCDLLEIVGLEICPTNYKMFRILLNEEIAQKTGYDRKHTFTEIEKDLIISYFKK